MMLGTKSAGGDDEMLDQLTLLQPRPSQFDTEPSDIVKRFAEVFSAAWTENFSPAAPTPQEPTVPYHHRPITKF